MLDPVPRPPNAAGEAGTETPRLRSKAWLPLLTYGTVGGFLLALLRWVEYRYLVIEHSFEIYGGLVAILFAAVGIWLGTRLARRAPERLVVEVPVPVAGEAEFRLDEARQRELGITARELEVLVLIATGLSTREIAGRLFVSENTVKTHAGRLFDKLGARRRTEAVRRGKEMGLIP